MQDCASFSRCSLQDGNIRKQVGCLGRVLMMGLSCLVILIGGGKNPSRVLIRWLWENLYSNGGGWSSNQLLC